MPGVVEKYSQINYLLPVKNVDYDNNFNFTGIPYNNSDNG